MASERVVYRWELWRELFGAPNSRQRKELEKRLTTAPALLYWGDSWFMTPLYGNLAAQSMRGIDGVAMVMGKPGATAEDLFSPRSIKAVVKRLEGNPFDVLCVSAGGNDGLSGRLEAVFGKRWDGPVLTPEAAFKRLQGAGMFKGMRQRYTDLLKALAPLSKARPWFRVVGHGYAPLLRIGVPGDLTLANIGLLAVLKRGVGPWLWTPMQHVLADRDAGKAFADLLLLDGFRDQVLVPLANEFPGLFTYADFSGVAQIDQTSFWFDEIHPTEKGFATLAKVFNGVIRAALPAGKQGAVQ